VRVDFCEILVLVEGALVPTSSAYVLWADCPVYSLLQGWLGGLFFCVLGVVGA
jgi:hypothetical protein